MLVPMIKSSRPAQNPKPKTHTKTEDFDRLLAEYYELRGWDERGFPPSTSNGNREG